MRAVKHRMHEFTDSVDAIKRHGAHRCILDDCARTKHRYGPPTPKTKKPNPGSWQTLDKSIQNARYRRTDGTDTTTNTRHEGTMAGGHFLSPLSAHTKERAQRHNLSIPTSRYLIKYVFPLVNRCHDLCPLTQNTTEREGR